MNHLKLCLVRIVLDGEAIVAFHMVKSTPIILLYIYLVTPKKLLRKIELSVLRFAYQ